MVDKIPVHVFCISFKHKQLFHSRSSNLEYICELGPVYGTFCSVDIVTIIQALFYTGLCWLSLFLYTQNVIIATCNSTSSI